MQSIIIPVVLLALLALWGVWETGRKFRREFRLRGISWESVEVAASRGEGALVVDTLWGPQHGLGLPVIWWLAEAPSANTDLGQLIASDGSARLVRCPRRMRSESALRERFGPARVLVHTWNIAVPLTRPEGGPS